MATEENQEVNKNETEANTPETVLKTTETETENNLQTAVLFDPTKIELDADYKVKNQISGRCNDSVHTLFYKLREFKGLDPKEFMNWMVKAAASTVSTENKPKTIEVIKEVPKEVEVIKEVEKQLQGNQILLNLSDKQTEYLNLVQEARFIEAKKKTRAGEETPVKESKGMILKKSFFHRSRLLNLDSNFYTGVPQNALD